MSLRRGVFGGISVSGDENCSYILKKEIEKRLFCFSKKLGGCSIKIVIEDRVDQSAYTKEDVIKEQKEISVCVSIFAGNEEVAKNVFDSAVLYEVNDAVPLQNIFSGKCVTEQALIDLASSISAFIVSTIRYM